MKQYKTTLDRPHLPQISILDRTFMELSPYMTELEVDRVVEVMNTLAQSKLEDGWTADDAVSQLRLILGSERVYELKAQWSRKNSHLVAKMDNKVKYIRKSDNTIWCGLDETDDPNDYIKIRM